MLADTLIKWRDQIVREAEEIRQQGLREVQASQKEAGQRIQDACRAVEQAHRAVLAARQAALKQKLAGRLEAYKKVLLKQMGLRFGRLPKTVRNRVEQMSSMSELKQLARDILSFKSLKEMGLR